MGGHPDVVLLARGEVVDGKYGLGVGPDIVVDQPPGGVDELHQLILDDEARDPAAPGVPGREVQRDGRVVDGRNSVCRCGRSDRRHS